MKYINNVDVKVNPVDGNAFTTSSMLYKTILSLDSKFVQPGFKYNSLIMRDCGYYDASLLKVNFVNGYERTYDIGITQFKTIKHEIDWINDMVEFERSMNGNDDELEDDA